MRIFENKSVFKKLIIVFICILIFSFCVPNCVRADDGIGGKLLNPVMSLFVSLGDGAMALLQKVVYNSDTSLINIDTSTDFWAKFIVIVTAIVIAAVAIAAVVFTGGGAAVVALGVIKVTLVTGAITTITFPVTTSLVEGALPESFYLPLYSITPQEIFSNKIPLLDVDFFNPDEDKKIEGTTKTVEKEVKVIDKKMQELKENHGFTSLEDTFIETQQSENNQGGKYKYDVYAWNYNGRKYQLTYFKDTKAWNCKSFNPDNGKNVEWIFGNKSDYIYDSQTQIEVETYSQEGATIKSTAKQLQSTISNWYIILRDIALVALLSVLVYIGIRILISSTSSDKAKYKQMLLDWIVAICLLFIMQYIMSFSNLLVDKITDMVDTTEINKDANSEVIEPEMYEIQDKDVVKKAYETLVGKPAERGEIESENKSPYYAFFVNNSGETAGSSSTRLLWPAENFMQQARINLQILEDNKETYVAIGWKLIYVVLVVFTFIFIFTYLKRVVYMAFLTIIAPLVALTYPIDKINDGKAQAFNIWLKEYIFNLLIQPMHLLVYTILVGSAMDFASENILYVVVALGFMVPAEKLLRKFFGFEKAQTPGLLAGPAGAAVMMNGMNKLFGKGSKGGKTAKGNAGSGKEVSSGKSDKIKFKDAGGIEEQIDSGSLANNDIRLNAGTNVDNDVNNSPIGGTVNVATASSNVLASNSNVSNNNQKPQYMEDRIANWANDKLGLASQRMGEIRDSVNDNSIVKGTKNIAGKTIGKVKKLPQHSRLVNAGVKGIKKSANTVGNRIGNRIKDYNPAKSALNVAKVGAKAVTGGTVGLVGGTIAGIASGDASKAVQYATAGALGGYKVADSIGTSVGKNFSDSGFKEAAIEGYYGDDYDQHLINKKIKEMQSDYDINQKVLRKFDGDKVKAKDFMNDVVPEYVNYGVTEMKDIMAAYELEKDGVDRRMAISVASTVNEFGKNTSKLGAKDSEDLDKTILNRTRNRYAAKTAEQIEKLTKEGKLTIQQKEIETKKLHESQKVAKNTRDLMNKYSKIKFKK